MACLRQTATKITAQTWWDKVKDKHESERGRQGRDKLIGECTIIAIQTPPTPTITSTMDCFIREKQYKIEVPLPAVMCGAISQRKAFVANQERHNV